MSRITLQTIDILEREGLADALNELGIVLAGHGLEKHGTQKWRTKLQGDHITKMYRHAMSRGLDHESGRQSMAHAAVRALMVCQLRIEGGK